MAAYDRARIEAYIGATGAGKGVSIHRRLLELAPRRLLIWDPRDEYARHAERVERLPDLVARFRAAGAGSVAVRYVPGSGLKLAQAFGLVCDLAFAAGDLVIVAEELSDTTSASWAPPAWRRLTAQGRHRGLHIIAAAQRPALVDKTFLGNCTYVRCFALRYARDRAAMAELLGVELAEVTALATRDSRTYVRMRYIEREFGAGPAQPGELTLRRRGAPT